MYTDGKDEVDGLCIIRKELCGMYALIKND